MNGPLSSTTSLHLLKISFTSSLRLVIRWCWGSGGAAPEYGRLKGKRPVSISVLGKVKGMSALAVGTTRATVTPTMPGPTPVAVLGEPFFA